MKKSTRCFGALLGLFLAATTTCKKETVIVAPDSPTAMISKLEKDGDAVEAIYNNDDSIKK